MSIELIKQLREITLAGLSDCKEALLATNNDLEKAIEYLRSNNKNVATKKASRDTKHSISAIAVSEDFKLAYLIRISTETDFVSRNTVFAELALNIAKHSLKYKTDDISKLLSSSSNYLNEHNLENYIENAISKLGENIILNEVIELNTSDSDSEYISYYVHGKSKNSLGEILENVGSVICAVGLKNYEANINFDRLNNIGRDIGMHITAMKPLAVTPDSISSELIAKEEAFLSKQVEEEFSNKPENVKLKALEGRKAKFLKENALTMQQFCKDNSKTVGEYLSENKISINWFKMI
ncbi:MAG: translation elongation factor Ts [Rickettsiales bacterium]